MLLACCHAFEAFGVTRREAIWLSAAVPLTLLIDDERSGEITFPEEKSLDKIQLDYRSFEATLGDHPSLVIKQESWLYSIDLSRIATSEKLSQERNGSFVYVFGMMIIRQAPPTAKGMVFITLEDETGFINVAIKPDFYTRYFHLIEGQGFCACEVFFKKIRKVIQYWPVRYCR